MSKNIISDAETDRFTRIIAEVTESAVERSSIGILSEKTLHAVIKAFCDEDRSHHEQRLEGYVADIFDGNRVTEIQTRSFRNLREKLAVFTKKYPVTVVYPLVMQTTVRKVLKDTGEVLKPRKSPKKGSFHSFLFELYELMDLVSDPNIKFRVLQVNIEEYRLVKNEKDRGEKGDRIPSALLGDYSFDLAEDFAELLPEALPSCFTAEEYSKAARLHKSDVYRELKVFVRLGVLKEAEKQGRVKSWTRACN